MACVRCVCERSGSYSPRPLPGRPPPRPPPRLPPRPNAPGTQHTQVGLITSLENRSYLGILDECFSITLIGIGLGPFRLGMFMRMGLILKSMNKESALNKYSILKLIPQ